MKIECSLDFCKDFDAYIKKQSESFNGQQNIISGTDLWYRYFLIQKKLIHSQKREVLVSKEFVCPDYLTETVNVLKDKIESGQNINVHLSKDALDTEQNDGMLFDWGIHHLHLNDEINPRTGQTYIQKKCCLHDLMLNMHIS